MTGGKRATIVVEEALVTLINVYEVAPERQAELARLLADVTERVMRRLPGFVSVSVHCSLDGTRVVNYAQWASREAFDQMLRSPEAQKELKQLAAVAKSVAPALYEVRSVHTK